MGTPTLTGTTQTDELYYGFGGYTKNNSWGFPKNRRAGSGSVQALIQAVGRSDRRVFGCITSKYNVIQRITRKRPQRTKEGGEIKIKSFQHSTTIVKTFQR